MIRCSEIMTHPVQYCAPEESIKEVAEIMKAANIGCVPVASYETKLLLGIISERDLVLKVLAEGKHPNEMKAGEVMSHSFITCTPDTSLDEVVRLMGEHQLRRMPVVDQDYRLVGIVSVSDIAERIPPHTMDLLVSVLGANKAGKSG